LHTSGRDTGDTRLGAEGRLVGTESASGAAGSGFTDPQADSASAKISPNTMLGKMDFILRFMLTV